MLAGFVVRARAVDTAIILGNVKVDRPGTQRVGHRFIGGVEFLVAIALLQKGMFGRIVA